MRNILSATTAAVLAMLATSGIVALATAAPNEEEPVQDALAHPLADHLDNVIARQLREVRERLEQERRAQ